MAELARLYRLAQAKIKAKDPNVEDATRTRDRQAPCW